MDSRVRAMTGMGVVWLWHFKALEFTLGWTGLLAKVKEYMEDIIPLSL